ncbi:MAG: RDD family protein [Bdellovibrionota bacterium]
MFESNLDHAELPVDKLLSGKRRGTMENRFWAKLIDFSVVMGSLFAVYWFFGAAWVFLAAPLLWAFIEIWNEGQSPGKWLLGLQVVDSLGAQLPTFSGCLIRNFPFILLSVSIFYFDHIIGFSGVILAILFLALETYFVLLIQTGIRIGDVLSTTRVQDFRDQHMRFIEQYLKDDAE